MRRDLSSRTPLFVVSLALVALACLYWSAPLEAHGVSNRDAAFVRTVIGPAPVPV